MTAAFPSITATVATDGYSEQRQANVIAFRPETGRPIQRRRTSTSDVIISCKIHLTWNDWDVLENFYHVTLSDGVLPFTWTQPRTQQAGTFQFEGDPPTIVQIMAEDDVFIQFKLRTISLTGTAPGLISHLLLESGDNILLENGTDAILLEA